jgi:hypothetical protein
MHLARHQKKPPSTAVLNFFMIRLFSQHTQCPRQGHFGSAVIASVVFSFALISQPYDLRPFRW